MFGEPWITAAHEVVNVINKEKKTKHGEITQAKGTHSPASREEPAARNSQNKAMWPGPAKLKT